MSDQKGGFQYLCLLSKLMLPREHGEFYYMPNPKASLTFFPCKKTSESDIIWGWCKSPKPNKHTLLDDHLRPLLSCLNSHWTDASWAAKALRPQITSGTRRRRLNQKGMLQLDGWELSFSTEPMMTSCEQLVCWLKKNVEIQDRHGQLNLERTYLSSF